MADLNPLHYRYGSSQGRIIPSHFESQDGDYVFALGSDISLYHSLIVDDYARVTQTLDLTTANLIRVAAGMRQPLDMPKYLRLSGHDSGGTWIYTASLKRGDVLHYTHPKSIAKFPEPYSVTSSGTLIVSIDGGSDQTPVIPGRLAPYSIAELAAIIAPQLTGATITTVEASESVYMCVQGDGLGKISTVFVSGGTALPKFLFPTRLCYGGDNLSAIIAPDAHFTQHHVGHPLLISNASQPANNKTTFIYKIINETSAVLFGDFIAEAPGFEAELVGFSWECSLLIDSVIEKKIVLDLGRDIRSNDFAVNVSKLTGNHDVSFQLRLALTD